MRKCDEDRLYTLSLTYEKEGEVIEVESWQFYIHDFRDTLDEIWGLLARRQAWKIKVPKRRK